MTTLSLEAVCATPEKVERIQVSWNKETGLIEAVGNLGIPTNKLDYIYDDHCLLFAGMGDVHIHAREDVSGKNLYKESFATASSAAINGGVVHCCDMPNNPIAPIDDNSYKAKMKLSSGSDISLFLYAGIGPETNPLSFRVPYKAYMGPSVGDLFFKDHLSLDKALERYKGMDVSFHCEDPDVLEKNKNEDSHGARRPVEAEVLATHQALEFIQRYQLKGKLCHYSSGEGLDAIRAFRKSGNQVEIEVTPQHLYFNQSQIAKSESHWFQMNPPIREKIDQEAMLQAFINGEIDYLATDHAPHTIEEKHQGISGMPGLDTYATLVGWLLEDVGVKPETLALTCSRNPGRFVSRFLRTWKDLDNSYNALGNGFGELKEGYSASFTILNRKKPLTIHNNMMKTNVKWSPFNGISFPSSLEALFINGNYTNL